MCGRYFLDATVFISFPVFGIWVRGQFEGLTNIAPSETVPVVHREGAQLVADSMKWGYQPGWDKGPKFIINLKSETILEKKFAQSSLKSKRCILPASGFFEWKEVAPKSKVPYAFQLEDKSAFGIAALYFEKNDSEKECVLLTSDANSIVGEVHDRMPVILSPDNWKDWVSETDLKSLIDTYAKPFSRSVMKAHRVDERFNKAEYKGELSFGT